MNPLAFCQQQLVILKRLEKKGTLNIIGYILKSKKLFFRGLYHGTLYRPWDMEYKT